MTDTYVRPSKWRKEILKRREVRRARSKGAIKNDNDNRSL